ncbi:hypothetical protein [Salininema proteolyticum]|uniref:Uncharacterized protein n=1 Tax=Salininema proteolyticum TaxID=1607685 RepID=A0ABV8TVH5_9ACTN
MSLVTLFKVSITNVISLAPGESDRASRRRRSELAQVKEMFGDMKEQRRTLYLKGYRRGDNELQEVYWDRMGHERVIPWKLAGSMNRHFTDMNRIEAYEDGPSTGTLKRMRKNLVKDLPKFRHSIAQVSFKVDE